MKTKLCDVNAAAVDKLPRRLGRQVGDRRSLRGRVHQADEHETGGRHSGQVQAAGSEDHALRRRKKGDGLMRRLAMGPDPVPMLDAALQEAARNAGIELTVENGAIFLSL